MNEAATRNNSVLATSAEVAGLLVLAALLALAASWFLPYAPPPPVELAGPGITPVGMETAQSLHAKGVMFIDARSREEFQAGHVPGARWAPAEGEVPAAAGDAPVVVYGEAGDMSQALPLAERLLKAGRKTVYLFMEGVEGWRAAGLALEAGPPGAGAAGKK